MPRGECGGVKKGCYFCTQAEGMGDAAHVKGRESRQGPGTLDGHVVGFDSGCRLGRVWQQQSTTPHALAIVMYTLANGEKAPPRVPATCRHLAKSIRSCANNAVLGVLSSCRTKETGSCQLRRVRPPRLADMARTEPAGRVGRDPRLLEHSVWVVDLCWDGCCRAHARGRVHG